MRKSRFTETQIIAILKESDAGMKVEVICRKHGISNATCYNWKYKYGGMEASDIKRIKELARVLRYIGCPVSQERIYSHISRNFWRDGELYKCNPPEKSEQL